MNAKSIKGKSPEEIMSSLQDAMADGFKPTLAIMFISIKQDRNLVVDMLVKMGMDVIGATSSGEFVNGHQSEGEIVIMLLEIPRDYYTILYEDIADKDLETATRKMIDNAFQKFEKPAFILLTTLLRSDGSLSYDIITKGHGGELKVETMVGKGTEFIIQLPAGIS